MLNTIRRWPRTARTIRQDFGLSGLLWANCLFLMSPIYECKTYNLYEHHVKRDLGSDEPLRSTGASEINFKIVSSNQEADKLESENYGFRSYPTDFNYGLTTYTRWLEQGATAFCTFVGTEFAAITWIVSSQPTQDNIKAPPMRIDYANHEALGRGAWVNPKYRGIGLNKYSERNRDRYLAGIGIDVIRSCIELWNRTGIDLTSSVGWRQYGRARELRILLWKAWRETHADGKYPRFHKGRLLEPVRDSNIHEELKQ
jgi:hypothetical protein